MFHENAVLEICYCYRNKVFLQNLCQADALDQEPLSKVLPNERPGTVAFEVEPAFVECPLKIFKSTPAKCNTVFTHPELIEETNLLI